MKRMGSPTFRIAGLPALIMLTVMAIQGAALKTATTPMGILDLELAGTVARVDEILQAWQYLNNTALWNNLIDYGFLTAYSFFFAKGIQFLLNQWPIERLQKLSGILLLLPWVPGILDAIENAFMLGWLLNFVPAYSPALVYWMVCVKFALAALLFIICFPAWLYNFYLLMRPKS